MTTNDVAPSGGPAWRDLLIAKVDGHGRWLGNRVVRSAPSDSIVAPASRYLEVDFLNDVIRRTGGLDVNPDTDVRVAASRFLRHYSMAVTAAALLGLGEGIGLTLSNDRCTIAMRGSATASHPRFAVVLDDYIGDVVRCAERPTTWPVEGPTVATLSELREVVWEALYARHFAPLFERVREVVKVGTKLSWSSAAESVSLVSDTSDDEDVELDPKLIEDRAALLEAAHLPGMTGNPMAGLVEWRPYDAPDFPQGVVVRHVCCLNYLMIDRGARLCGNCCFLPLEDAVALVRERRTVAAGVPSGPAEERAKELGRAKLRTG